MKVLNEAYALFKKLETQLKKLINFIKGFMMSNQKFNELLRKQPLSCFLVLYQVVLMK